MRGEEEHDGQAWNGITRIRHGTRRDRAYRGSSHRRDRARPCGRGRHLGMARHRPRHRQTAAGTAASGGRVNGLASASGNKQRTTTRRVSSAACSGRRTVAPTGPTSTDICRRSCGTSRSTRRTTTTCTRRRSTTVASARCRASSARTTAATRGATRQARRHRRAGRRRSRSCATARRTEPAAFGIGIHPTNNDVYIGTNCGVARSFDSGATWSFSDPTVGERRLRRLGRRRQR